MKLGRINDIVRRVVTEGKTPARVVEQLAAKEPGLTVSKVKELVAIVGDGDPKDQKVLDALRKVSSNAPVVKKAVKK